MSTKFTCLLGLILVLCLTAVSVATAAPITPPIADMCTNRGAASTPSCLGVDLWASLSGGVGGCRTTRITYVKFSLASLPPGQALGPLTQVALTKNGADPNPDNYTIGLYRVDNAWTESSTWNTAPAPGALIAAQPVPAADNVPVIFGGADLASYVQLANNADAEDAVSFAVQLVSAGSCTQNLVSVYFDSANKTGGVAPALSLFSPTAVELTTLTAEQPAPNLPLYIGLGVLAVLIGGLLFYRRRDMAR